jgi:nicotinamide-nucleotide amidase
VVADREYDIVATIRLQLERTELRRIFVCGGLGPTPDDRTYAAIAAAFDRPLVYDRMTGARMQERIFALRLWARRGTAELNAGNRKMALVPEGAILLQNGPGMAPGLAIEVAHDRYLFALPGVPHEFKDVFDNQIAPRFLQGQVADVVRELHYRMAPESAFHDAMLVLEREYPDVSLGSYPQPQSATLVLRASGSDPERVEAVLEAIRRSVTRYQPVDWSTTGR